MRVQQFRLLVDLKKLDIENKRGIGRDNRREATGAIGVVRRASQKSTLTNRHLSNPLVPATNNVTNTELEGEGCATGTGAVEHLALRRLKRASIVDGDSVILLGLHAIALDKRFDLEGLGLLGCSHSTDAKEGGCGNGDRASGGDFGDGLGVEACKCREHGGVDGELPVDKVRWGAGGN